MIKKKTELRDEHDTIHSCFLTNNTDSTIDLMLKAYKIIFDSLESENER